jgi:hypothetical protein
MAQVARETNARNVRNRMLELGTSESVGGEGATSSPTRQKANGCRIRPIWAVLASWKDSRGCKLSVVPHGRHQGLPARGRR